ncbi:MAG: monovalent cation/H+ antiporter complex subunit F [Pseudomonadota bacterium]
MGTIFDVDLGRHSHLSLLGFVIDRPEFLDISLVYALINFIGTIAVTKYCVFTDFNAPLEEQDWDDI